MQGSWARKLVARQPASPTVRWGPELTYFRPAVWLLRETDLGSATGPQVLWRRLGKVRSVFSSLSEWTSQRNPSKSHWDVSWWGSITGLSLSGKTQWVGVGPLPVLLFLFQNFPETKAVQTQHVKPQWEPPSHVVANSRHAAPSFHRFYSLMIKIIENKHQNCPGH